MARTSLHITVLWSVKAQFYSYYNLDPDLFTPTSAGRISMKSESQEVSSLDCINVFYISFSPTANKTTDFIQSLFYNCLQNKINYISIITLLLTKYFQRLKNIRNT